MNGSVTQWLDSMKSGDQDAISSLWSRYNGRMRACARKAVKGYRDGGYDDEDVASMAFSRFIDGAQKGVFPKLIDRNDFWKLLMVITSRTAQGCMTHELAQKRGAGKRTDSSEGMEERSVSERTPRCILIANDELNRLLVTLDDDELREVAVLSMQGLTTAEVAHRLGSTQRTVQRMLALIRQCWAAEAERLGISIPD